MASFNKTVYGNMPDGTPVHQFELTNENGLKLAVIEYGGIITQLHVPDKNGSFTDVVLGHDSLEEYLISGFYFGALIGRYGNRIANAAFELDGSTYTLESNDGANNLHGGPDGFDKVIWTGSETASEDGVALSLSYRSKDGEMGFPGNMDVEVIYNLTNENALEVLYKAVSDKKNHHQPYAAQLF